MNLFAQHGHGKSDKIDKALQEMSIDGVILSPKNELTTTLDATINNLRKEHPRCQILMDPQFHYSVFSPVKSGNLENYSYFSGGLTRADFLSATKIKQYVKDALEYQNTRTLDYLLSPTVFFNSFDDTWSQVALQMAQASIEAHAEMPSPPPLLISLIFCESALTHNSSLDEYLNMLTGLEADGFYITVRRQISNYRPNIDPGQLASLMYLIYSLAERNDYEVLMGYTDFIGVIFQSFDILGTSSGWFSTTRQFTAKTYEPQSGGSPPKPRYSSQHLLNSILVYPEFAMALRLGLQQEILSETEYDSIIEGSLDNWNNVIGALHHWSVLKQIADKVRKQNTIPERLDYLNAMIKNAQQLYQKHVNAGMLFDISSSSSHLDQWERGIKLFRDRINL